MFTRRHVIAGTAGAVAARVVSSAQAQTAPAAAPGAAPAATPGAAAANGRLFDPRLPAGVAESARLESPSPGKQPLIKLSYRPPNYESPMSVFRSVITPNESFFVRWHLADIPVIDAAKWSLAVDGKTPLTLSFDQLRNDFPAHEVVAVCQCSGNRRGFSQPHVPGVQWSYGAMGNARWKGARLKDILAKAGLPDGAVEIAMNGADKGPLAATPDFIKSVPLWKANDDDTIVAYEMNGAPLPHLNGAPVRLIVPGWTATYWVKALTQLTPLTKPEDSFWMKSAYRVPTRLFPSSERFVSQENDTTTPITEMVVNSIITSHADGAAVPAGPLTLKGLAWDGGHGVNAVDVSLDGGATWRAAQLGEDLGRYSFREWSFAAPTDRPQKFTVTARASNAIGQTQTAKALFNPAGYHHNVMHQITLTTG